MAVEKAYIIDSVLDYGVRAYHGKEHTSYRLAFEVLWKGYAPSANTWEPRESFTDQAFLEKEIARMQKEDPYKASPEECDLKAQEMTEKAAAKGVGKKPKTVAKKKVVSKKVAAGVRKSPRKRE